MKKILTVDDDTMILESIALILKSEGYEPILAQNARTATRVVKKYKPALILLDIRLPDIPGTQVAQMIKEDQETRDIPVVLISANFDGKRASQSSGADDFLEKPFDRDKLTNTIKKYLN